MRRLGSLKHINFVLLLGCGILASSAVDGQPTSDLEAVKAANQAFYSALSAHNMNAMRDVWATGSNITNIGPGSKSVAVGWDAIGKGFEGNWAAVRDLKATIDDPHIKIVSGVAWVVGVEQTQRSDKTGAMVNSTNLVTNIFQKQDARWVMVHHHASRMPQ